MSSEMGSWFRMSGRFMGVNIQSRGCHLHDMAGCSYLHQLLQYLSVWKSCPSGIGGVSGRSRSDSLFVFTEVWTSKTHLCSKADFCRVKMWLKICSFWGMFLLTMGSRSTGAIFRPYHFPHKVECLKKPQNFSFCCLLLPWLSSSWDKNLK